MPRQSDIQNTWETNRRQLKARGREYQTQLSDISRLFQRVLINGTDEHRAELKAILAGTKAKLVELIERIERG